MIIWIASYPRSGSTFFRIALHALYGYKTYTGFKSGDDIEIDTNRQDLTGHAPLPKELQRMLKSGGVDVAGELQRLHESSQVYFIKSHCTYSEMEESPFPVILIVRDPRDTFLSFSHYIINTQRTWSRLKHDYISSRQNLRDLKTWTKLGRSGVKTGVISISKLLGLKKIMRLGILITIVRSSRWSDFYRGWLERSHVPTVLVRFEQLVHEPHTTLCNALDALGIQSDLQQGDIPSFEDLKKIHPSFFRQGRSGTWLEQMPGFVSSMASSKHKTMLSKLGYDEY